MVIPDEALEAAFSKMPYQAADYIDTDTMREILEAAAPHIQAQALVDAVDAFPLETIHAPDTAVVWMMRRAEEIEGRA